MADAGQTGDVERPRWSQVQADHATLEQEARYLVRAAAAGGLLVRAVGGVAIYHRLSPDSRAEYERLRSVPHDIDLLTKPKTSNQVKELFMSLGYVADERMIAWMGNTRHRYFHLDDEGHPKIEVDVFLGKPPLCHEVDFLPRLDMPGPAMSATDLLLQKIQIHDPSDKDQLDALFLLGDFPLVDNGEDGLAVISSVRTADLLARDWGFYYTATTNLDGLRESVPAGMDHEFAERALARAGELRAAIENAPKGRRWKMRAKVGTRTQWYEDVEEVLR